MKKLFLLIPLLIGLTQTHFAQSYYPILDNEISHFGTADTSLFLSLKSDSMHVHPDHTTYYLFKQLRGDVPCIHPNGDSWLGDTMSVQSNGFITFVNKNHLPFLINYKAKKGDTWIAYKNGNWQAQANVSSLKKETFLGLSDSVKTITLNILKLNGGDTSHVYDGLEIKLSKQYGILKIINFYTWDIQPSPLFLTFPEDLNVLNLPIAGFEKAKIGLLNLTSKEIFDFQPGDELDISSRSYGPIGPNEITGNDEKMVILERIDLGNRCKVDRTTVDYVSKVVMRDTILFYDYPSDSILLEKIPNEVSTSYGYIPRIEKVNGKRIKRMYVTSLGYGSDTCLTGLVVGGYCPEKTHDYYVGLGGPYFQGAGPGWGCEGNEVQLVYYKKGALESGTPIVLGLEDETELYLSYQLVPNPAHENVRLKGFGKEVDIMILDMNGKTQLAFPHVSPSTSLDIRSLTSGIYFYKLSQGEKILKTGKLLVD
jgi:hypothetical protein